jgi:glycosyltransferase involved in cell wall biosynthesis
LADATALVMCSDSESFGMSIVEALAAGVPVVVTKTCPWQEVETAGCGFWVEQQAATLAEAIDRLLANPSQARAMGERGRAWVQSRYSWHSIAGAMADRYAAVVSGEW